MQEPDQPLFTQCGAMKPFVSQPIELERRSSAVQIFSAMRPAGHRIFQAAGPHAGEAHAAADEHGQPIVLPHECRPLDASGMKPADRRERFADLRLLVSEAWGKDAMSGGRHRMKPPAAKMKIASDACSPEANLTEGKERFSPLTAHSGQRILVDQV